MMESKRCENLLLFSHEIKIKTNKRSVDVLTTIKEVLLCCFKFFVCENEKKYICIFGLTEGFAFTMAVVSEQNQSDKKGEPPNCQIFSLKDPHIYVTIKYIPERIFSCW